MTSKGEGAARDGATSRGGTGPRKGDPYTRAVPASPAFSRISALERAAIDAAPASIAVLDDRGLIIAVNRAWRATGTENGRADTSGDLGLEYAAVGEPLAGDEAFLCWSAADVLMSGGVRAVLAGTAVRFTTVYSCPVAGGDAWFRMLAMRAGAASSPLRVLVLHRRQVEAPTAKDVMPMGDETALRWMGISTQCAWCGQLARDTLGDWVPVERASPALTVSHGMCPACYATSHGEERSGPSAD